MGSLRLGRVARVIPFPVAAGFPASSGWLLVVAGLSLLTHQPGLTGFPLTIRMQDISWNLIFAAILVLSFFLAQGVVPGAVAVLAPLLVALAAFYVMLAVYGYSVADARALGLLPDVSEKAVNLPNLQLLSAIHWPIVFAASATIAFAILVNIFGFVLNTSAIELAVGSDVDMDREARLTGATNLAIGAFGGGTGYIAASSTVLAHTLGGDSRVMGLSFGLITLAGSAFATFIVSHVPVFAAGGLVLFIGLSMLHVSEKLCKNNYLLAEMER